MKKFSKGFTLIELLIVIALLGALAVGLLAALDPFEQLKKGTDTGVRNTVSEFHGAAIRFYALKNQMPWCDPAVSPATCNDPSDVTLTTVNGGPYYNAVDQVVNSGELKTEFVNLAGNQMGLIHVSGTNDPPTMVVCFQPTSKSFQSDKNTKYNSDGTLYSGGGSCKSAGGAVDCWWCIQ